MKNNIKVLVLATDGMVQREVDLGGATRMVKALVHDGQEIVETAIDAARYAQLYNSMKHSGIVGDGSDVPGRIVHDAGEALSFVVAQLTFTEAQIYARQYLPLQYKRFLPVSNEAGEWATGIRYEKTDFVGNVEWASDAGDDFPVADVQYDDTLAPIHHALAGYQYTLQEIRETAFLRRPLNERRMVACMEMVDRFHNRIGLFGDAKKNLSGLFNSTVVPKDVAANGNWDDPATDPLKILADVNTILYTPYAASGFNDLPDTLLVPPAAMKAFVSRPVVIGGVAVAVSIYKWLMENNICVGEGGSGFKLTIASGFKLDKAGSATKNGALTGANSRCIAYVNNKDRVVYDIPMPVRFIAPQYKGAKVLVPGELRSGGVRFKYPSSAFYCDNVLKAG